MSDGITAIERDAHGKGCWYFITVWSCVLCGRSSEIRERQTSPRPDEYEKRHEFIEEACGDHFA